MLARILPGERAVALAGLDEDRIQAEDAAGAPRALPNLSTGTQHALGPGRQTGLGPQASRRSRASSCWTNLSWPWMRRAKRALWRCCATSISRHGWQIILLTKEIRLKDKMRSIFAEARIIELAPGIRESPISRKRPSPGNRPCSPCVVSVAARRPSGARFRTATPCVSRIPRASANVIIGELPHGR